MGVELWCVSAKGGYYDSDPRMPGREKISATAYVMADGYREALAKAEPHFAFVRERSTEQVEVIANIVILETLQVIGPGRPTYGWIPKVIELSNPEDRERYRLVVVLEVIR